MQLAASITGHLAMLRHEVSHSKFHVAHLPAATLISLALVAAVWQAGPAQADDLVVRYDQSQLLRLPRPASEVIIGNPSIADVNIQGADLLVITGKTFGVTNVIALDSDRNVIQDQRVVVQRDEQRMVNLHKGAARQSFTCTPACQPTITIGDDPTYFDLIAKHAASKTKFSESGDAGGGGGGGGGQ